MQLTGLTNYGAGSPVNVKMRVRGNVVGGAFNIRFGSGTQVDISSYIYYGSWNVFNITLTAGGVAGTLDFPVSGNYNRWNIDIDYISVSYRNDVNLYIQSGNLTYPHNLIVNVNYNTNATVATNAALNVGNLWANGTTIRINNYAVINGAVNTVASVTGVGPYGVGGNGANGASSAAVPAAASSGSPGLTGPTGAWGGAAIQVGPNLPTGIKVFINNSGTLIGATGGPGGPGGPGGGGGGGGGGFYSAKADPTAGGGGGGGGGGNGGGNGGSGGTPGTAYSGVTTYTLFGGNGGPGSNNGGYIGGAGGGGGNGGGGGTAGSNSSIAGGPGGGAGGQGPTGPIGYRGSVIMGSSSVIVTNTGTMSGPMG
jgi:hypothetical protein